MDAHNRVLLDANIWYSRTLTDWFFLIYLDSERPPFLILWSEDILAEAHFHLRKNNPSLPSGTIDKRFERIRGILKNGRIKDYEIGDRSHPDEGDWHVINAAISGHAGYLITNDKKFVSLDPDTLPFEIHNADSFLTMLADSNPHLIESAARKQWNYWNKKQSAAWRNGCAVPNFNLVKQLENAGCPRFADHIREFLISSDL